MFLSQRSNALFESARDSSRHRKQKLGSCPDLCCVRPVYFSVGGPRTDQEKHQVWSKWPCTTQLFREKTFESCCLSCLWERDWSQWGGASPFRRRNRQIGTDHRQAAKCHVLAGQARTLPGFVPSYWRAREKSRSPFYFERHFWDSSVPSGATGLARNVVGWQGQEPRRFELAAPEPGLAGLAVEGWRPKHSP